MRVTIRAHGVLRAEANISCEEIVMPEGATLGDLLDKVGIRRDAPALSVVDGRVAGVDQALSEGSEVSVFARVSGG